MEHLDGKALALIRDHRVNSEFRVKLIATIEACKDRGVFMVPFFVNRTPWQQAELYRRSRKTSVINVIIRNLADAKACYLAHVLEEVGPQKSGNWATNALPGHSWHQWGEAADCYVRGAEGRPVWDAGHEGYEIYAEEAEKQGLTSGHRWKSKDSVHIQLNPEEVGEVYTLIEIDNEMFKRYGDNIKWNGCSE